jgi:hypothetical protein
MAAFETELYRNSENEGIYFSLSLINYEYKSVSCFLVINLSLPLNIGCLNFGGPEVTCKWCHAEVWYEERAEKSKYHVDPEFSICCQKGQVELPLIGKPPDLLLSLINGSDHRSKHFKENIRAYNSMFAFTSMGGKIKDSINDGGGPPQFILGGQNYHRIGSLLPQPGTTPKFAQLYIYDTQHEVENRVAHFRYIKLDFSLELLFYLINALTIWLFFSIVNSLQVWF